MTAVKINLNHDPVQQLRKLGYQVRVTHSRFYHDYEKINEQLAKNSIKPIITRAIEIPNYDSPGMSLALSNGGSTEVVVVTPDGEEFVGRSECSINEAFNKKIGVKIAICRILKCL